MNIDWAKWRAFLSDARYMLMFYVVGDMLTTWVAINLGGEEGNLLPAILLKHYGMFSLVIMKLFTVGLMYYTYKIYSTPARISKWNMVKQIVVIFGIAATVSNTIAIVTLVIH